MAAKLNAFRPRDISLLPGTFLDRFNVNRGYVMRLQPQALLQNHLLEAGLSNIQLRDVTHRKQPRYGDDMHWGWESPTCQVRGHFLGHWMSAAARIVASTGDAELKARADGVVETLGRCQQENGGEWVGSIPPKYLEWIARGKSVWAPHYVLHKTLMGLHDMHVWTGSEQALEIAENFARWFHRFTADFSREEMDNILDFETGGMLEAWANLYGVTGKQEHADLIERYDRPRLFDRLLAGGDPLTNMHANTTIPEAHGAARAYEVTGEKRWRRIVEAYWRFAVTDRGYFCTGGQTAGEIWTPPHQFAARLGEKNQEHCTIYNMMRLADYLFRWTGDVGYADYIERNLYNGILAQQHPGTGQINYFLEMQPGATKHWGSETNDFWCCHGTLVQAHTAHDAYVYYGDGEGLTVCQYVPSRLERGNVEISQSFDAHADAITSYEQSGSQAVDRPTAASRPKHWTILMTVKCAKPKEFALRLRLPRWIAGEPTILVNGQPEDVTSGPSSFHSIRREWNDDAISIQLPKGLTTCPLPDEPDTVAFMDGPMVLAGLCGEERTLVGDTNDPSTVLAPAREREWGVWQDNYRTINQDRRIDFKPIHEVVDEPYTLYFPVRSGTDS